MEWIRKRLAEPPTLPEIARKAGLPRRGGGSQRE